MTLKYFMLFHEPPPLPILKRLEICPAETDAESEGVGGGWRMRFCEQLKKNYFSN